MPTSSDLLDDPIGLFPLLSRKRVVSVHNPRAMTSSTLKAAWIRLLRSWNGMPTRRLANLGCRFRRTISIWSCSLGQSIMLATLAFQWLTNEEIDSSDLFLVASNSRLETSMSVLKANWIRNSWDTSSQVRTFEGSTEANHLWPTPLSNIGKMATNCASSILCALMTVLYSLKRILGQPIPL